MPEISIDGLESQVPRKDRNFFQRLAGRFRGEARLVEPTEESRRESYIEGETKIERTALYEEIKADAEFEDKMDGDIARRIKIKGEKIQNIARTKESFENDLNKFNKMMEGLESGETGTETDAESVIEAIKMLYNVVHLGDSIKNVETRLKAAKGDLPNIRLRNDLEMVTPVILSETKVRALEKDIQNGLERVRDVNETNVTMEDLSKLQEVGAKYKDIAVSIVAELGVQEAILKRVAERRRQRFPMVEDKVKAEEYIKKKKNVMTPKIEGAGEGIFAEELRNRVLVFAEELGVTDVLVKTETLESLGYKKGEVLEGSVLDKYGDNLVTFKNSILSMKEAIDSSVENQDTVMAAYLALNRAIIAGGSVLKLEESIRGVMVEAAFKEAQIPLENYAKADERARVLVDRIRALQRRGLKEKAFSGVVMVGVWAKEAIDDLIDWAGENESKESKPRIAQLNYAQELAEENEEDMQKLERKILSVK